MTVTVDVNVLVYAWNEIDPMHKAAVDLVDRLMAGPEVVYLFWPVLLGYLRIASAPSILPAPGSTRDLLANIGAMLARSHVRAPGEADGFWEIFTETAGGRLRGANVTDAHIAALMRQHGVRRIYTRDRDFRLFDGIEPVDPFA